MFDLQAEIAAVAESPEVPWGELDGSCVLVTGATGLVGSYCVRVLLQRNRAHGAGMHVLALVRDRAKAQEVFQGYGEADGLELLVGDVAALPQLFAGAGACACSGAGAKPLVRVPQFIIHGACPTASRFFTEHPVETADAVVGGTVNVLKLARACKVRSMVHLSSMEVYGDGNLQPGLDHLLGPGDEGKVEPMSVRSCYPEGKRMAEQYCAGYAAEYGVPVKVARLAQTFGPGIPKDDRRVFAMMARCASSGEDIVLKTTGASTRMYAYTSDAVRALLVILLKGQVGCAYNVANPETYSSVREMAQRVADECAAVPVQVVVDVDPAAPYPPEHHLPLDVSPLTALGWTPQVGLAQMYRNLMAYLED